VYAVQTENKCMVFKQKTLLFT